MIMRSFTLAAGLALLAPAAFAQPTPEQFKMVYEASRNQLGVLEYCQASGAADAETIAVQKRVMAMLPPPSDTSGGDAAYATGKTGAVVAGDQRVTLAEAAKAQNVTEQALCQRMGATVKSAASSLPPG
jgi:hypothetical protein